MVSEMDQVLAYSEVGNADNLAEISGLVPCAAVATRQVLDCKVRTRDETNATKQKVRAKRNPSSLERRGLKNRSTEADVISPILPSISRKKKIRARKFVFRVGVRIIHKNLGVKASDKELVTKIKMEDVRLQQRAATLGSKIKQYNKAARRRSFVHSQPKKFLPGNLRNVEQIKATSKFPHLLPVRPNFGQASGLHLSSIQKMHA
jgi:hypothetical protein